MIFAPCLAIRGQTTLATGSPDVHVFHDVLFCPGPGGGMFDRARRLIPTAARLWALPQLHYTNAPLFSRLDPDTVDADPSGGTFMFVGECHGHFGHFIVGTLSRFWALRQTIGPGIKLLFQDGRSPSAFVSGGFQQEIFSALGLAASDFASFSSPVRLRQVIVPSASFEENNIVYSAFGALCRGIGQSITAGCVAEASGRPVYLSKHRLSAGVSHAVNEIEVANRLERHGVEIVSPELLSLREQILLWRRRPLVTGWIGSAFHMSVFGEPARLAALHYEPIAYSNQLLIDLVAGNAALHMYPTEGVERAHGDGHFGNSFRLTNPEQTAEGILRIIDQLASLDARKGHTLTRQPRSKNQPVTDYNLIGPNLATDKPTSQSSTSEWSKDPEPSVDSAGGRSGFLTGSYQFHTAFEPQPWWQVDLIDRHRLEFVRLYNRCDIAFERAASFELLVSDDGSNWQLIYAKRDFTPFGGLIGGPFIFAPLAMTIARFLRVRLLTTDYFHLDQVEILGTVASNRSDV